MAVMLRIVSHCISWANWQKENRGSFQITD